MSGIQIKLRENKESEKGSSIFIVRTTIGQERLVANSILLRLNNNPALKIKAILVPQVLKGYLFIEATESAQVINAIQGLRHVRGYTVVGKLDIDEIEHFLIPAPPTQGLNVSDEVEIISGPFKGERAKIKRIEASKDEVVLELFESPYPIPIKVHADFIKLVRSSQEPVKKEEKVFLKKKKKQEKKSFIEKERKKRGKEEIEDGVESKKEIELTEKAGEEEEEERFFSI